MKLLLALALIAVSAQAASLKDAVKSSLLANTDTQLDVKGVDNCENKCQNLLGYLSYYTAAQQQQNGQGNNEYRGCILGCNQCNVQLAQNLTATNCFDYCKNYNYFTAPGGAIQKGVIEPDKACIIGCVIQLCQGLCTGPGNWNPDGSGCMLQSGYGIQTYNIGSGTGFDAACCTKLQNMCTYNGAKGKNYNSIERQAFSNCNGFPIGNGDTISPSTSPSDMCTAWKTCPQAPTVSP